MGLEVIVLGASGTFPQPGLACSGYLLRSGSTDVWLDCGPGTFANLQRHTDYHMLSAVVLSHLHIDHILDVFPFYHGLAYSRDSRGPRGIPVHAPAGAKDHLRRLLTPGVGDAFCTYLSFQVISDQSEFAVGDIRLRFARSRHPIETLAVRAEVDGRVVAYTADTGPSPGVTELARGSDVLIAEASLHQPDPDLADVHMTAEEAGAMAAEAGVGMLVLTHISPGLDPEESVALARGRYGGEIVLAADNLRLDV
ncbi:MAG: MBL fold metallo-hydrolase [Actinomycetota bacterium]